MVKTKSKYQDRIILYLDILGFKEMILSPKEKDGITVNKIIEVSKKTKEVLAISPKMWSSSFTRKSILFSDTVVISYESLEIEDAIFAFRDIQLLIGIFIHYGLLIRGAVVRGKLYHNSNILFGPGLINAYLTESKTAIYPRIVVDNSVLKWAKIAIDTNLDDENNAGFILKDILKKDLDDMYYIDYFYNMSYLLTLINDLKSIFGDYGNYMNELSKLINDNKNNPDHSIRQKYHWMKNKYNLAIRKINREDNKSLKQYNLKRISN